MMETVTATFARRNLPELLRRVQAGESFAIEKHGKVVATLIGDDLPPLRDPDLIVVTTRVVGDGSLTVGGNGAAGSTQEARSEVGTGQDSSKPPKPAPVASSQRRLGPAAGLTMLELAKLTRR